MFACSSGRNDLDMLVAIIAFVPSMCYQNEYDAINHPCCLPPLFAIFNAILPCEMKGVVKNQFGECKADTVFLYITKIFGVIS